MFKFETLSEKTEILASINEIPMLFKTDDRNLFLANHAFNQAWDSKDAWLENAMFTFLKNLMLASDVEIKVASLPQERANKKYEYGSYGVTGDIAWNMTENDIEIKLTNGVNVTIPKFGWVKI
jgi:hypothetical protein